MILEAVMCLALNVYWETRGQAYVEQLAVSHVVMNRVADTRYPNTICEVVKQGKTRDGKIVLNQCQFSWYCDGKPDEPVQNKAWHTAVYVAEQVYHRTIPDITEGATHYHAVYVTPAWAAKKIRITQIGLHWFYRCEEKGR